MPDSHASQHEPWVSFSVEQDIEKAEELRQLFAAAGEDEAKQKLLRMPFLFSILEQLEQCDGSRGAQEIGQRQFENLYQVVRECRATPTMPSIEDLLMHSARLDEMNAIPIVVVEAQYTRPDPESVEILKEVANGSGSPKKPLRLEERRAFFASPLLPYRFKEFCLEPPVHRGKTVRFILDRDWWISEHDDQEEVNIDFGDGLGRRVVRLGEIFEVTYQDADLAHIEISVGSGEAYRSARACLNIAVPYSVPPWDALWALEAEEGFGGKKTKGKAYVLYGYDEGGVKRTKLKHPILVVEGFPGGLSYEDFFHAINEELTIYRLVLEGFDAVFLTFEEGTADLRCNAFLIMAAIKKIKNMLAPNSKIPCVLGASMGGLVCRYALAYMEKNIQGGEHGVEIFLTYDSPHRGAYINPGLQWIVHGFAEKLHSGEAKMMASLFTSTAAKQMLLYNVPYFEYSGPLVAQEHTEFFKSLSDLGYPKKTTNLAVVNGASTGKEAIPASATLVHWSWENWPDFIDLFALPNDVVKTVAEIFIWPLDFKMEVKNVKNIDGAPGGLRPSNKHFADAIRNWDIGGPVNTKNPYPDHCFIPSCSALGLDQSYYEPIPAQGASSIIKKYYIASKNTDHVAITAAMSKFLTGEMLTSYRLPHIRLTCSKEGQAKGNYLASSFDGISWSIAKNTIGEQDEASMHSCSMVVFKGQLYVSVSGKEGTIRVARSRDGAKWSWVNKPQYYKDNLFNGMKTKYAPCLAVCWNSLVMTVPGEAGEVYLAFWNPEHLFWGAVHLFKQVKTKFAPSIAGLPARSFMTLPIAKDNGATIRFASTTNLVIWGSLPDDDLFGGWVSKFAPSLVAAPDKNRLFMTLPGGDGDIRVVSYSEDEKKWSAAGPALFDKLKTKFPPSLAYIGGQLYLSLPVSESEIQIASSLDGVSWKMIKTSVLPFKLVTSPVIGEFRAGE